MLVATLIALTSLQADFPFVIPGNDVERGTATDFSGLSPRPAGAHGFVRVKDGRFATDAGRLRIWGVNLCFGAVFPGVLRAAAVRPC